MSTDFKISKKHKFFFDFDVDGEKKREIIEIDMTEKNISNKLFEVQNIVKKRIEELENNKADLTKYKLPEKIETIQDIENLSPEEVSGIKGVSKIYTDLTTNVEKIIIEEISNALGSDISCLFKYCSPLSVIDGVPFISLVLENLGEKMIDYYKNNNQSKIDWNKKSYLKKYMPRKI